MAKRIGSVLLALALLLAALSGCGEKPAEDSSLLPETAGTRIGQGAYDPVYPRMRQEAVPEFQAALNALWAQRPLAEAFLQDEALAMAESDPIAEGSHDALICPVDKIPSAEIIARQIRVNNAAAALGEGQSLPPGELVEQTAALAAEDLARWLPALEEEERLRIWCSLDQLKVLCFTGTAEDEGINAYVTGDMTLLLCPERISALGDPQAMEKTILHELQHVFQRACPEVNGENTQAIGPSRLWPGLTVNSLWWSWCHEGAAERHVMEVYGGEPLVYPGSVAWVTLFDLAALPGTGATLERAALSDDPWAYVDALGMESPAECSWALWMLYAVECVENSRLDFAAAYRWKLGRTADWAEIREILAPAAALGLSGVFYRNLSLRAETGEVSLQDICCLITLFEGAIARCLPDQEALTDFAEDYTALQDAFFALLETAGVSPAEMLEGYALSTEGERGTEDNWSLAWLEEDARQQAEGLLREEKDELIPPLRDLAQSGRETTREEEQ